MTGFPRRAALAGLTGALIFLSGCGMAGRDAGPPPRVFIAGDSTASAYPPERAPRQGWGQALGERFDPRVAVVNRAVSGRSTRSFIDEGHWDRLVAELAPGDWVLIQFGHNDQKAEDPRRFADPATTYRENLARFIRDVRARGAHPVLLTSVARRRFRDGRMVDTHGAWPPAMKAVAAAEGVPLLDLDAVTRARFTAVGEEGSKRHYLHVTAAEGFPAYPEGAADDTHFRAEGARLVAGMVAGAIREAGLPLARWLR